MKTNIPIYALTALLIPVFSFSDDAKTEKNAILSLNNIVIFEDIVPDFPNTNAVNIFEKEAGRPPSQEDKETLQKIVFRTRLYAISKIAEGRLISAVLDENLKKKGAGSGRAAVKNLEKEIAAKYRKEHPNKDIRDREIVYKWINEEKKKVEIKILDPEYAEVADFLSKKSSLPSLPVLVSDYVKSLRTK